MLDRVSQGISVVLAISSSVLIVMIMLIVSLDVGRRSLGVGSLRGGAELAEVMLVAAAFLALAYAQRVQAHVGTSLLTDRLPLSVARRVESLGLWMMVLLFSWMTWETGLRAWSSFQSSEVRFGVRQVPVWPARSAVAIGLAALTLEIVVTAVTRWREAQAATAASKA